ncbi:MAG TPA: hypothetical protein VK503_03050 [Candidatus Bathyarchaeia archaeon]|nr:hypothetical protein [Candidatus Bathyarchaeia archaeon]
MVQTFAKSRNYAILAIVLIVAVIAVGASSNPVLADPCTAQLNYPIMPVGYSNSNVPIVVPVSATCSTIYGNQLYATGNAYDTTSNAGLGSVSTALQSVNGGTTFNGQLGFNLPPSTQGDTVQFTVSIYDSQYGNLITATSETVQVGTGIQQVQQVQQVSTTTVTQAYPYPSQNPYQPPSPSYQYSSQPSLHRNQSKYQLLNHNRSSLLGYVAIITILAVVIITTAGLVMYGRRQQPPSVNWIPAPPPPR